MWSCTKVKSAVKSSPPRTLEGWSSASAPWEETKGPGKITLHELHKKFIINKYKCSLTYNLDWYLQKCFKYGSKTLCNVMFPVFFSFELFFHLDYIKFFWTIFFYLNYFIWTIFMFIWTIFCSFKLFLCSFELFFCLLELFYVHLNYFFVGLNYFYAHLNYFFVHCDYFFLISVSYPSLLFLKPSSYPSLLFLNLVLIHPYSLKHGSVPSILIFKPVSYPSLLFLNLVLIHPYSF